MRHYLKSSQHACIFRDHFLGAVACEHRLVLCVCVCVCVCVSVCVLLRICVRVCLQFVCVCAYQSYPLHVCWWFVCVSQSRIKKYKFMFASLCTNKVWAVLSRVLGYMFISTENIYNVDQTHRHAKTHTQTQKHTHKETHTYTHTHTATSAI